MSIKVYPITLGIGGGTSSGKTTLAKQLCAVLPNCTVVHQDHYWTDPEECIIHPIYQQPDLEDPRTAITWPLFRAELKKIKDRTGHSVTLEAAGEPGNSQQDRTETDISTEDFGNLSDETILEWVQRFHDLDEAWKSRGMLLKWYIVEGWHLYYDSGVIEQLDLRLLIRSPGSVLQKRREKRKYKLKDGSTWVDPPHFWERFGYPGYVRSHSHLFQGEIDTGPLSSIAISANIILLDGEGTKQNLSHEDIFQHAARAILLVGDPSRAQATSL